MINCFALPHVGTFGEVVYSIVGDHSANFEIDVDTGIITVQNTSALDREIEPEVTLTAIASDRAPISTKRSTTVSVHIKILDENDNSPTFTQKIYHATVAENAALSPPAAILQVSFRNLLKMFQVENYLINLQVSAFDPDEDDFGVVKYSIVAGNTDYTFRLDPDSGILYPGKSLLGQNGEF